MMAETEENPLINFNLHFGPILVFILQNIMALTFQNRKLVSRVHQLGFSVSTQIMLLG